jgi:hypothetical protein
MKTDRYFTLIGIRIRPALTLSLLCEVMESLIADRVILCDNESFVGRKEHWAETLILKPFT